MLGLDSGLSTSAKNSCIETCSEFRYTKMLEDPTNGDLRNTKCGVHVLHPFDTEFHNSSRRMHWVPCKADFAQYLSSTGHENKRSQLVYPRG